MGAAVHWIILQSGTHTHTSTLHLAFLAHCLGLYGITFNMDSIKIIGVIGFKLWGPY